LLIYVINQNTILVFLLQFNMDGKTPISAAQCITEYRQGMSKDKKNQAKENKRSSADIK